MTLPLDRLQIKKYYFKSTSSVSRVLDESEEEEEQEIYKNPRQVYVIKNKTDTGGCLDEQSCDSDGRQRVLQSGSVYSILDIQISSNRFVEYLPSPTTQADMLNNKTVQLKAAMPAFDNTYSIIPSTFIQYKPSFISAPTLLQVGWTSANFTITLDQPGFVYISAQAVNGTDNLQPPYPDQIYWGYSYNNKKVPSGTVEVSQGYIPFNITLTNLTSNTQYSAYVIAGSVHPGYPDLMDSSKMSTISLKTLISPDDLVLDIDYSGRLSTCFWIIALLIPSVL